MPISQAVDLLQSPDAASLGSLETVLASPDAYEQDLVLIAAAIYARPGILPQDLATRLTGLLADSAAPPRTRSLAREVLTFVLATPLASSVLGEVNSLALQPGYSPDVYAESCQILEAAAAWACPLVDVAAMVAMAESAHLQSYRERLCALVIEPALHASGAMVDAALLERIHRLYGRNPGLPHLLHTIRCWQQFPAETRDWAAHALPGLFPHHDPVTRRFSGDGRRVLIIQNIKDGQGDEVVRWVPLAQAFLDFNPKLEVTVVTRRIYLASHPRVTLVPIADRPAVDDVLQQPFDAVVDFYEPSVPEINHDLELETRVQNYVQERKPFLFASSTKAFNHFVFERVDLDGQDIASAAGLNVQRVKSTYETTVRLLAQLGLPLRCGEDLPASEFVLAGIDWPEARAAWRVLVLGNGAERPIALLNFFGGIERLKGFMPESFGAAAAEIERLVGEGHFVVILPNGTEWGGAAAAEDLAKNISPACREFVAIAPDPAGSDKMHQMAPGTPPLSHADYVMRQFLYFARYADLIVTVEGWLMHVAWCLGKPYRVLMAPLSHAPKWHPYLRTRRQGIELNPAPWSGNLSPSAPAPLVEQPRKFVLIFLLREFGQAVDSAALPIIRKALASPDRYLRRAAAVALAKFNVPELANDLLSLLADPWCEVRAAAAEGLLKRSETASISQSQLLGHLYIGKKQRDWRSVVGLGQDALPAVELALRDEDDVVRREAVQARLMLDFQIKLRQRLSEGSQKPSPSPIWRALRLLLTPRSELRPKPAVRPGAVLILTPVKNAADLVDAYCQRIERLTYPHEEISLGFLESDSHDQTYEALSSRRRALGKKFRRAEIWKKDFGYKLPIGIHRGAEAIQAQRRTILARSRNHLLFHALDDEEWVLWLDADVIEYPPDIIQRLLATGKEIVQPHCVVDYGGETFDKNAWRDHGRLHLEDLRPEGDLVELDAVGGTMLLVRADLHREGLIFPAFPYGLANSRIRGNHGELETEGLGIMARDMGYQCWGMPNLEIRHGRW